MSVGIASAAVPLRSVHGIDTYHRSAYYLQRRNSSKLDDVPAGPTVSNKPSRLKANNVLASSWAILAKS